MTELIRQFNAHNITRTLMSYIGKPTDEEIQYCIEFYDDLFDNLCEAGPTFDCVLEHVIGLSQVFENEQRLRDKIKTKVDLQSDPPF
jgi:hypothetical protein